MGFVVKDFTTEEYSAIADGILSHPVANRQTLHSVAEKYYSLIIQKCVQTSFRQINSYCCNTLKSTILYISIKSPIISVDYTLIVLHFKNLSIIFTL